MKHMILQLQLSDELTFPEGGIMKKIKMSKGFYKLEKFIERLDNGRTKNNYRRLHGLPPIRRRHY